MDNERREQSIILLKEWNLLRIILNINV
jgi:hypothetical protein